MSLTLYPNTDEYARKVGWADFPDYCYGDPTAEFVLHDPLKGEFHYIDVSKYPNGGPQ